MLAKFASDARKRMRNETGGYRRDHPRALVQRVEVATDEARVRGPKSNLLQALVAAATEKKPGAAPSFLTEWRTRHCYNFCRRPTRDDPTPTVQSGLSILKCYRFLGTSFH